MLKDGKVRLSGAEQVTIIIKSKYKTGWFGYLVNVKNMEDVKQAKKLLAFEKKHQIRFYLSKLDEIRFRRVRKK